MLLLLLRELGVDGGEAAGDGFLAEDLEAASWCQHFWSSCAFVSFRGRLPGLPMYLVVLDSLGRSSDGETYSSSLRPFMLVVTCLNAKGSDYRAISIIPGRQERKLGSG